MTTRSLTPAALGLLAALSLGGPVAIALRPVPDAALLVWFGPDRFARAIAADARPIAPGPLGSLLVRGEGDLAARLFDAGALLVLRADALTGCPGATAAEGRR